MSKKCPECESKNIHITYYPVPTDSMATCYDCGYADLLERFPEQSVFDHITASPEVLAEKSVYQNYIGLWCSPFIQWGKDTKVEAIDATVARLKEVAE